MKHKKIRKKILYRDHGNFEYSMEQVQEFSTYEDVFKYVLRRWRGHIKREDLTLSRVMCDDDRIGWTNVRYVQTYAFGNDRYKIPQCVGYCGFAHKKRKQNDPVEYTKNYFNLYAWGSDKGEK